MPTPDELKAKFWKAIRSDMTLMLGLVGAEDGHTRPMTAQFEDEDEGPLWFFTSIETALVEKLGDSSSAVATYASKDHDMFASVSGTLIRDRDQAQVDRLWNKYTAAWFEGGKTDPKLALLRFDLEEAEIWENGSSLIAGIKMLLGSDPKEDYKDSVATVSLS